MSNGTTTSHRARWAAIGAAIAVTIGAGTITTVNAVQSDGERSTFTAITPCRLADTRTGPNNVGPRDGALGSAETITIDANGPAGDCSATQLPADAKALVLNVTALGATEQSFLTFWPDGTQPLAASLNPAPGQPPVPNAVTTNLSPANRFNLFNNRGDVHVVIDVAGYYVDHNHDDRYDTSGQVDAKIDTKIDTNPGPTGPTGATGDQGPQGEIGPAGPVGRPYGRLIAGYQTVDGFIGIGTSDITLDAFGAPVISFHDTTSDDLRVATCGDPTCTEAHIELIDTADEVGADSSIAIGASGAPVIVYTDTGNNQVKLAQCEERNCVLGVGLGNIVTVLATAASQGDLAIDPSGNPIISAYGSGQLLLVACTVANCALDARTVVDSDGDSGRHSSIAIGANGNPIISYLGGPTATPELRLAICGNPTCSLSVIRAIGPADSGPTTLVVDPSGNPVMAFEKDGPAIARCADATCATSTTHKIAGTAATDVNVSMSIGTNGLPAVAWYDSAGDQLVVAMCNTETCDSIDETPVLKQSGNYGEFSAMTIGGLGNPLVSFNDLVQAELGLASMSRTSFTPNGWQS